MGTFFGERGGVWELGGRRVEDERERGEVRGWVMWVGGGDCRAFFFFFVFGVWILFHKVVS